MSRREASRYVSEGNFLTIVKGPRKRRWSFVLSSVAVVAAVMAMTSPTLYVALVKRFLSYLAYSVILVQLSAGVHPLLVPLVS